MSESQAPVTSVRQGAITVITMDDGKVNAVNDVMLDALEPALAAAQQASRAVVLAGREGVFSGGFDLGVVGHGGPRAEKLMWRGMAFVDAVYRSPVPVVVACTGHAVALGAVLLLSADLRVGASGDHNVGLNEVSIGIPVPPVLADLARSRLSPARLTEAVLLARVWTPQQAVDVGFLDEVAEPDRVLARAVELARDLAGRLQPDAYLETKQNLRPVEVTRG
jgi:enoyl-CoA hydratase